MLFILANYLIILSYYLLLNIFMIISISAFFSFKICSVSDYKSTILSRLNCENLKSALKNKQQTRTSEQSPSLSLSRSGVLTHDIEMFGNSWVEVEPREARCPMVPSDFPSPCAAVEAHVLLVRDTPTPQQQIP